MARSYPPKFRHRLLDLLAAGKKVAEVAEALDVRGRTIYNWRIRTGSTARCEALGIKGSPPSSGSS